MEQQQLEELCRTVCEGIWQPGIDVPGRLYNSARWRGRFTDATSLYLTEWPVPKDTTRMTLCPMTTTTNSVFSTEDLHVMVSAIEERVDAS